MADRLGQHQGDGNGLHNDLPPEEEFIDLRSILQVITKWKKVIIGGTLLTVLTAAVLSWFVLPPVYEAKAMLMVTQSAEQQGAVQQSDGVEGVVENLTRIPVLTMNTYLGQLKSGDVMERVIKKLDLDPLLYTPGSLSTMTSVSVQKDSNLIDVKVENGDPKLAQRIANTLCSEYLKMLSEKNQEQLSRSVNFLEEERQKTEKELEKAIQELKKYQSEPRGVAVLEEEFKLKVADLANYKSSRDTVSVEIRQLDAGISRLEEELAATPETVTYQRFDKTTGEPLTGEEMNPIYAEIAGKLADKRATLAEKEAELGAIESVASGMTGDLDALHAELTAKKAQQDKLQDEVERLKETLNTLSAKTTETQIAKSLDLGRTTVSVVSEASAPTSPVKPQKTLNVAIAFMLGLMVFIGLSFVFEHLDYTLKTPEDIAKHLDLPALGVIPIANKRSFKSSYGGQRISS